MMFDIFSSFDPANLVSLNLIPLEVMWVLLTPAFFIYFWASPSMSDLLLAPFSSSCSMPTSKSMNIKFLPGILLAIFSAIILFNWVGLIPYTFSLSSHMLFTFTLAFPSWLAIIMSSASNSALSFISSFIPSGAPSWLAPFLLIIECISVFVRPITLSFRLAANISTGHVMMVIIGAYMTHFMLSNSSTLFILTLSIKAGYTLFEFAIGALQAYIFVLLLTLYTDEHS